VLPQTRQEESTGAHPLHPRLVLYSGSPVQEPLLKKLKMDEAEALSVIWDVALLSVMDGESMIETRVFSATKPDVTARKDHYSFVRSMMYSVCMGSLASE